MKAGFLCEHCKQEVVNDDVTVLLNSLIKQNLSLSRYIKILESRINRLKGKKNVFIKKDAENIEK
jgi:hypothetical protein